MMARRGTVIGGYHLPHGWDRTSSGTYTHPRFGTVHRQERQSNKYRWLALPTGYPPSTVPFITLRAAMLECERKVMEATGGTTQALVPGQSTSSHAGHG